MNQQNLKNSCSTSSSRVNSLSLLDLVQEMKCLGMDPEPILDIAANDIISLYGAQAGAFCALRLTQAIEDVNPNDIYLWKELYSILQNRLYSLPTTIH